jgi:pyruvate carboxylase
MWQGRPQSVQTANSRVVFDAECVAQLPPQVSIKFKAVSEPQPNGKVDVFFEVNGVPRVVEVAVSAKAAAASGSACGCSF